MTSSSENVRVVEVFADIVCPFTHIGLHRFVEQRAAAGAGNVVLRIRAWPLEIVNNEPLDAHFIAEEVADIRTQLDEPPFAGFDESAFPTSTLPALALVDAAYQRDLRTGEAVSLQLRRLLFEDGVDVADRRVLAEIAKQHGLTLTDANADAVRADHAEGVRRGVIGSPHFFTPDGGSMFCPGLDVGRNSAGALVVAQRADFLSFVRRCLDGETGTDDR